jgi:hypothetical protein
VRSTARAALAPLASPVALASLIALASPALPTRAAAHGPSTTYSTSHWRFEREEGAVEARVVVQVPWADLQRALRVDASAPTASLSERSALERTVDAHLTEQVALLQDGRRCPPVGPVASRPSPDPEHLSRAWRVRCPGTGPVTLQVDLLFSVRPGHVHLARITTAGGRTFEHVFVADRTRASLALGDAAGAESGVAEFLRLGIEHIFTGTDHLAFLLALLLMGSSFGRLATLVTGFTVAHSLTLALGVLGWVEPRREAVEALIGLSVAVVALENFALTGGPRLHRRVALLLAAAMLLATGAAATGRLVVPITALVGVGLFSLCYLVWVGRVEEPARLRWFVAFVFGLVHGFGFAGLLLELGLPPGRIASSLFGFNAGVEVEQLAIVAMVWPLLRFLRRHRAEWADAWVQWGSTPVLAAGVYWFLSRGLG